MKHKPLLSLLKKQKSTVIKMNIFQLQSVGLSDKDKSILTDISFTVAEGERLTLVGPSGSGKSSILKLLAGLTSATSGTIFFQGRDIAELDMPTYRREVSYCFQQPVLFGQTVQDNLQFPFTIRQLAFDQTKALKALESVHLAPKFLSKKITELSGGEKQRVALIRNLLFEPKVLLLDEISAGLDAETKAIVNKLLADYQAAGNTLIEVTHDQSEIDAAQKILRIEGGRVQV